MKYLDYRGLAYFYQKIKSLLNGKLNNSNPTSKGTLNHTGDAVVSGGLTVGGKRVLTESDAQTLLNEIKTLRTALESKQDKVNTWGDLNGD